MKTNKIIKFIAIYLLSGMAFFALTMPFHKIFAVFTVSEVRPSAVLYPLLGISFGLPSALGIMTANFISDFVNGYPLAVLLEGIIPQILYTMVPYYMWKRLTKGEKHIHRLDSVSRVLKFALICFVFAVLSGIGVGLIVHFNFGADGINSGFFVFLNNFDISLMLGCPLMVLSNQVISRFNETERIFTANERIILFTSAAEIVVTAIVIPSVYYRHATIGTYDIWNTIYLYLVVIINVIMIFSLLFMSVERKTKILDRSNDW